MDLVCNGVRPRFFFRFTSSLDPSAKEHAYNREGGPRGIQTMPKMEHLKFYTIWILTPWCRMHRARAHKPKLRPTPSHNATEPNNKEFKKKKKIHRRREQGKSCGKHWTENMNCVAETHCRRNRRRRHHRWWLRRIWIAKYFLIIGEGTHIITRIIIIIIIYARDSDTVIQDTQRRRDAYSIIIIIY